MANVIEVILKFIDQASAGVTAAEAKMTTSTAAIKTGFDDVGTSSDKVNKRLGEYGAAVSNVERIQNQLKQVQLEAVDAASKLAQAQKNLAENTDPSRTAELNRELVNAQVNLDKAGKEVQDLSTKLRTGQTAAENAGGGFSKMQAAIITVNQAMQLTQQIAGQVAQVYNSTIGATVEYAGKVKDLSETLSLSSEETSKLISIGQKFGVSTDTLTNSLQMMTKRGMAPTLEGLAGIADKVMAIKDPVQRSAMLVDLFGRNWTALFPILEKGGNAIRAAGDEASRFGKVLSEEDVAAAEKFSIAANTLGQDFDGLKIKMTKGIIPELVKSVEDFTYFIDKVQGLVTPLEDAKRTMDRVTAAFGENSPVTKAARKAYEDLRAELERDATAVKNFKNSIGAGLITDAVIEAAKRLKSGIAQIVDEGKRASSSGLVDYILAEEFAMKKAADASQALANSNMALLKIGVAGQLANESKQFASSQTDLQKRLKETADELADLERKQGAVSKTTVKNQMSDAELNLAQIKLAQTAQALAQAQNPVATAHQKTAKSAEAAAAAQAKLAKETDPLKQAALAAQIAVQQEKIDSANQSVNTYVDNSKRIEELKKTYDDLTAQIDANAKAHEEANKRILFDYAQQAIAQQNLRDNIPAMTKAQTDALDALAVKWGIKSQADVDAMNQMLLAAKKLSEDNSLPEFAAITQGALEGPLKPTDELIARMQAMQKEASDKMPKVATSISKIKPPAKEAFDQMAKLQIQTMTSGTAMQNTTQYGVIPMIKAMDLLAISLGTVNTQLGKLPTTLPSTNLPTPAPITPTTPPVRTYPLEGGAQHGLTNFVVPPNPHGGNGDYFPIMFAPGERVNATPQGQRGSMAGLNIGTVNINVGGSNATIPQIQQAVWTEMTRVIEAAQR